MYQLYTKRGITLFLCLLFCQVLFAQSGQRKSLKDDARVSDFTINETLKTPSSVSFKPSANLPATTAKSILQELFDLSADNELRLISSTEMKGQLRVDKYKQFFKGIKVEHSAYNALSKNGLLVSVSAEAYALDNAFTTAPLLTAETAKAKALDFVKATKYVWDVLEDDKKLYPGNLFMQQKLEALKQEHTPRAELVIANDVYGSKGPRLAFKYDIYAVQPLSRNIIFVDALTGKILLRDAVIKHVDNIKSDPKPETLKHVPNYQYYNLATKEYFRMPPRTTASVLASALTRYAGTRQIYTTKVTVPLAGMEDPNNTAAPLSYSGVDPRVPVTGRDVYILKDDTRGGGIETYDVSALGAGVPLSLPGIHAQALAFVDKDNIWKNEADNGAVTMEDLLRGATANGTDGANEAFNDDIAIDAHWGAGIVYDYWKQIHNRQSFDNKNSAILSYVHYGQAYDNAFWNGSAMTYGDGSGTAAAGFRPLTSLDVCGHEIGHGVCSFTADLVYESESGAMNEGLSDIWAAAVERFAKVNVDNTLNYQYFQVGEQIAADNVGLRRMDNPKAKTDPDTYGGRYWSNPNCVPSAANDNCGVHTNSGVLNKYFYLLVQGPGTTTGAPAYTDDGRADAGTTAALENLGNNYGILPEFIGIGFDKAEQITYLMELSLTPNAKFADARAASINAAKVLYGPCSQEEKSVWDAWYAVNVGPAWGGCTSPTLSVNVLDTVVTEGSGDCGSFTEITIGVNLIFAQATATNVNLNTGGTAEPHDYELMASSVSFNAGETGNKLIRLRIYNDDMVEGDETINLNATSNFAGFSFSKIITIMDDDVSPRFGNTFNIYSENFETVADNSLPAGWARVDKTNPSGGRWNVRQSPGASAITWFTKRAYVYDPNLPAALNGQPTYDINVATNVILRTGLIDARGLDSIRLKFNWSAGGEGACSPACDYADVLYSFDGVNFNRFDTDTSQQAKTASEPLYLSPVDSTYDNLLPSIVSNKQFYIGFRWVSDALATTSAANSVTIDNIVMTGQGRKIETDSFAAVSTPVHVEPGNPVFFYSENDKGLLSSIINASADLGCVLDTLIQTGNGTVPYSGGRRTRKVHEITPTQNGGANYTLTLYYTAAELAGFTVPPSQLRILKSNAANIDNSTGANSIIVTPSEFIDSSSQGFYGYTYTFTGFSKFAMVEPSIAPLPVNCLDFKATTATGNVGLAWKVGNDVAGVTYEVERSTDGVTFNKIGTVSTNGTGQYNFADRNVGGLRAVYYRIKAVEVNSAAKYLCTVLYVSFDGKNGFTVGNIYPNPGKGEALVNITLGATHKLRIEYINAVGQMVNAQQERLPAGATRVSLNVRALAAGSYLIHFKDNEGRIVNTQQFIKQ